MMHYKRQRKGKPLEAPHRSANHDAGCLVAGCDARHSGHGYCGKHLQRLRRTGDPLGFRKAPELPTPCTVCGDEPTRHGLCNRHYKINERHGTPTPDFRCKRCGISFEQDGSYIYCQPCYVGIPAAYRAARVARLAANNAGMSVEDKVLSEEYQAVLAGDPCVYCGQRSSAIDHILPVVAGGSDRWTNLAAVCKSCNSRKRDRSLLVVLPDLAGFHGCRFRSRDAGHVPKAN